MSTSLAKRVRRRIRRDADRARNRLESAWSKRRAPVVTGVVEKLAGREIVGWVEVPKDAPTVRVDLWLNNFQATSVAAVPTNSRNTNAEIRTFRFPLNDFWKYARTRDEVTVRVGHTRLPFTDRGMYYRPRNDGAAPLSDLKAKLNDGYVFASNGKLLLSKNRDLEWQASVMGLYNRVREVVKEVAGHDAFLVYGSLLGAVRDNGFIGHDFDFDGAYISEHRDGLAAATELAEIARALIDRGFNVESRVITLHIYDPQSSGIKIDLFHLFFDATGTLRFPWGVAGTTDFTLSQWKGTHEIAFGGSTGLIPYNAEAMVETMYGASWRTPNSGFSWARERRDRATEGRIPPKLGAEVNWDNFHAHTSIDAPSPYFQSVAETENLPHIVVDIGCGDGRDTIAFARSGRTALGIDLSEIALRTARERATALSDHERPAFVRCDIDDLEQFRSALGSVREPDSAPVLFYGRFLLHALQEDTQRNLFEALDGVVHEGDYLALEFRTPDDEKLPKARKLPFRRYIDPASLVAELGDEFGFVVESSASGTGLSPFENEDPELFRLLARRSR